MLDGWEGRSLWVMGRGVRLALVDAVPKTRYAKSGSVHVAHQVVGDGPVDLIVIPSFISHVESIWEEPSWARFYRRLASFSRLIVFDKRGTGMSDRVEGVPTLDERIDDVRAVMEAVGSERAALFGMSEGGSTAALFAATYPASVSALVILGSGAVGWIDAAQVESAVEDMESSWGSGARLAQGAPSVADNERIREWGGTFERRAASPGTMAALLRMNAAFDIRSALPSISTPTLVLHRTGDLVYDVEHGRYLGEHIPGARFVELPGTDHHPFWEEPDRILDLVEEFVTGTKTVDVDRFDRVLATVLFTDIVNSTAHASDLGDRAWRERLDDHDAMVRYELERFRGREINTTGDGFIATFDGPARAIRCGCAIRDGARGLGIEVRVGLHTGEVELRDADIGGISVHTASRVQALAEPGEVLVSRTVVDLVAGSGITFESRGEHQLKGIPGSWTLCAVQAAT